MEASIKIKVNNNYLKYRKVYIGEYLIYKSNKSFSLGFFTKNQFEKNDSEIIFLMKEFLEKSGVNSEGFFDKVNLLLLRNLVNGEKFFKDKRFSFLVINYLMKIYNYNLKNGAFPPSIITTENFSPIDIYSLNGEDMPFHCMMALLDFITIFIDYKKTITDIEKMKETYLSYYQEYQNPFSFLPKNRDALDWIVSRMKDSKINIWSENDVNVLIRNDGWKCVLSCFDVFLFLRISESKISDVKLFLLRTRKAWSQKKFRDGVKGKEVLNTYISKESKLKLKKIAKHHNKNINEIIEAMIDQIDLPEEPLEKLILTAKKEN
ncbi:hypothetical protein KMU_33540 [Proteus vulgaris]|uniref:hypothetical protein n=1 Tax=Proteus vulgaris TaxID=585 RepID=UPI002554B82F|nr:hypothetical protein [Proteus vulgaris]GLX65312.1 hypothetical protein KMU_33540 [Proteus vulgaris]